MNLKEYVRVVEDFPKKGISFKDITPLLRNASALRQVVHELKYHCLGRRIDAVIGIESRGFILGALLALELGVGFVPVRKAGKLPAATLREEYTLEYGTAAVEIHKDALRAGQGIIICDDLLATGGTALATAKLAAQLGAEVAGLLFVIELTSLKGREKLAGYDVVSLLQYDK